MKLFEKVKCQNGKRICYLFGLKIFSYKRSKRHVDLNNAYYIEGENNRFVLIENGIEKEIPFNKMEWLDMRIIGNNNVVKVVFPPFQGLNSPHININIEGNNNYCFFDKNVKGNIAVTCLDDNNVFEMGEYTDVGSLCIALHGNVCKIGKHCMFSSDIEIWTDGHAIIDAKTKELLNLPKTPVLIGNHCWIGRKVTFTKGAQIPDDCIVGIGSVVTKKFTEACSVIAGNPAKAVKTGISWDGRTPLVYKNEYNKEI